MRTPPAMFSQYAARRAASGGMVLWLQDYGTITNGAMVLDGPSLRFCTAPLADVAATFRAWDGLLSEITAITTSLDVYAMTTESSNCQVTLMALPYDRGDVGDATNRWVRVTDRMQKMMNAAAIVKLFPGGKIEFGDAASFFAVGSFRVSGIRMTDPGTIVLDLEQSDNAKIRNIVQLPQRKFTRALFPGIDQSLIGKTMPLYYGEIGGTDGASDTNELQEGYVAIERVANDTWLIADHEIQIYGRSTFVVLIDEIDSLALTVADDAAYQDSNSTAIYYNSGGRAYVKILDPFGATFHVVIPPTRGFLESAVDDPGMALAFDGDPGPGADTVAPIIAHSTSQAIAYFEWAQQGAPENDAVVNAIGGIYSSTAGIWLNIDSPSGITQIGLYVWDGAAWVLFETWDSVPNPDTWGDTGVGGIAGGRFHHFSYLSSYDYTGAKGTFWHLAAGPKGGGGFPFKIKIVCTNTNATWTPNSTKVLQISELRLSFDADLILPKAKGRRVTIYYTGRPGEYPAWTWDKPGAPGRPEIINSKIGLRNCLGRSYGAWGDEEPRYTNTWVFGPAGSIIDAPGYVIESILRDELGYSSSEIDTASFDMLEFANSSDDSDWLKWFTNTYSPVIRIPAGTEMPAQALLDKLCHEARAYLYYTADGKWRIKAYNVFPNGTGRHDPPSIYGTPPTPDAIIYPDDLIDMVPLLGQTPPDIIINDIEVSFSSIPSRSGYLWTSNFKDTASISRYGARQKSFALDSIGFGDPAGHVSDFANHLVGHTVDGFWHTGFGAWYEETYPFYGNGLLSRVHGKISLRTIGWKFAHLELGDVVSLDVSMDDHCLYFGQTWAQKAFLVVGVTIGLDGVDISLFDTRALY